MLLAVALLSGFGACGAQGWGGSAQTPPTRLLTSFVPTSAFPNRHARSVCSLRPSQAGERLRSACQIESLYGEESGRVKLGKAVQVDISLTPC